MAVNNVESTPESQAQEAQDTQSKVLSLSEGLVADIDLTEEVKEEEARSAKEQEEVVDEKEEESEGDGSETDETEDEGEENAKSSEVEDDDLIPKSKVQKRMDELTRQIRRLEAEAKTKNSEPAPTRDSDLAKLEKMNEGELQALKRQVRVAQVKAGDDDAKINELLDLEDKIESVIKDAPIKFNTKQINNFNEAVSRTIADVEDFDAVKEDIFNAAKRIYTKSPALQKSVNGQAEAWELAVEHNKLLSSRPNTKGDEKLADAKKELNKLKKRTSLDSNQLKGNVSKDRSQKMFERARSGDIYDKQAYAKEHWIKDMIDE